MKPAPQLPRDPKELENYLEERERQFGDVKEEARTRIVWADPRQKTTTQTALVYLHGFKASHGEGRPVHTEIARIFGFNLYLSRLAGHGRNIDKPFGNLEASDLIRSAKDALRVGSVLGKKILLMGTSTGASLALYLACLEEFKDRITGIILYSPLIRFHGLQVFLQYRPVRKLLQSTIGKKFLVHSKAETSESKKIWYNTYRLQGALALGTFIEQYMTEETFRSVDCPVFTGYYYGDFLDRDPVISIRAIFDMFSKLGTLPAEKRLVNFPEAGTHVIASDLYSRSIEEVVSKTGHFLEENGYQPVKTTQPRHDN